MRFTDNGENIGATINADSDGAAWSGSDKRTRLSFWTTAASATTPTERLRINSAGQTTFLKTVNNTPELIAGYGTTNGVYAGIGGENNFDSNQLCDLLFYSNGSSGSCSPTERMRITSTGQIVVNNTTPDNNTAAGAALLTLHGLPGTPNGEGVLQLRRGATPSAANNRLGRIKFDGTAGSNQGAWIQAQSDAAWTLNSDQPTHLAFGTCAASSASPTERLRITSDGTLQLRNSPGIDFSQIQTNAAGVTSETLDSYEEGTDAINCIRRK